MELIATTKVGFPRDLVFKTYRDKLPELVPHLPNVTSIVVKQRKDEGQKTTLVNLWTGRADIPAVAAKFVKQEMFQWTDFADWDEATYTCKWRSETGAFPGLVECSGTTAYVEVPGGTELRIVGNLVLHLSRAHIPRLLSGTVTPVVEKIIIGNLKPNLLSTGQGVEKYLQAQKR